MNRLLIVIIALMCCLRLAAAQTSNASKIANLIDPAKLCTLGERILACRRPFIAGNGA